MLQFVVAGPVVRGMAWLVDGLIRLVILIIFFIIVGIPGGGESRDVSASIGLFLIAQFLLNWFYTTIFEAATGTTPGKKLFNLWVVHDNATPITFSGALIRNFLRVADYLPFTYVTGLITMLLDTRFRRLGDLAAGTLVIYRDKAPSTITFTHELSVPPPEWLSLRERQAIVEFAERSVSLSVERQQELAQILEHLIEEPTPTPTATATDSVDILKSWAQWILRGQADAQSASV